MGTLQDLDLGEDPLNKKKDPLELVGLDKPIKDVQPFTALPGETVGERRRRMTPPGSPWFAIHNEGDNELASDYDARKPKPFGFIEQDALRKKQDPNYKLGSMPNGGDLVPNPDTRAPDFTDKPAVNPETAQHFRDFKKFEKDLDYLNRDKAHYGTIHAAKKKALSDFYENTVTPFYADNFSNEYEEPFKFDLDDQEKTAGFFKGIDDRYTGYQSRIDEGDTTWFGDDDAFIGAQNSMKSKRKYDLIKKKHERLLKDFNFSKSAVDKSIARKAAMTEAMMSLPLSFRNAAQEWKEENPDKPLSASALNKLLDQYKFEEPQYTIHGTLLNPTKVDPRKQLHDNYNLGSGVRGDPKNQAIQTKRLMAARRDGLKALEYDTKELDQVKKLKKHGYLYSMLGMVAGKSIYLNDEEREAINIDNALKAGINLYKGRPIKEAIEELGGEDRVIAARALDNAFTTFTAFQKAEMNFVSNLYKKGLDKAKEELELSEKAFQQAAKSAAALGFGSELEKRVTSVSGMQKFYNAFKRGDLIEDASDFVPQLMGMGEMNLTSATQLIETMKQMQSLPGGSSFEALKSMPAEDMADAFKNLFKNNPGAIPEMIAETIVSYFNTFFTEAPRTIGLATAAGAGTGATIGLAGGLPGAGAGLLIGGGKGFSAGVVANIGVSSFVLEYVSEFLSEFEKEGVDWQNPSVFMAAFNNPELMDRIRATAAKKAGGVALFDTAGGAVVGRMGRVFRNLSSLKKLPNGMTAFKQAVAAPVHSSPLKIGVTGAAELGVQAGLGGAGEWVSQEWAHPGEPKDYNAIMAELGIEIVGPGGAGLAINYTKSKFGKATMEDISGEEAKVVGTKKTDTGFVDSVNQAGFRYERHRFNTADQMIDHLTSVGKLDFNSPAGYLAARLIRLNYGLGKGGTMGVVVADRTPFSGANTRGMYKGGVVFLNKGALKGREDSASHVLLHEMGHFVQDSFFTPEQARDFYTKALPSIEERQAAWASYLLGKQVTDFNELSSTEQQQTIASMKSTSEMRHIAEWFTAQVAMSLAEESGVSAHPKIRQQVNKILKAIVSGDDENVNQFFPSNDNNIEVRAELLKNLGFDMATLENNRAELAIEPTSEGTIDASMNTADMANWDDNTKKVWAAFNGYPTWEALPDEFKQDMNQVDQATETQTSGTGLEDNYYRADSNTQTSTPTEKPFTTADPKEGEKIQQEAAKKGYQVTLEGDEKKFGVSSPEKQKPMTTIGEATKLSSKVLGAQSGNELDLTQKVRKTAEPTSYAKELVRNKAKEESNSVPSVIGSTEGSLPIDAMAKKKAEVAKATEDLKPKKTKPQLTEYAQSLIDKKQGKEPLKDTGDSKLRKETKEVVQVQRKKGLSTEEATVVEPVKKERKQSSRAKEETPTQAEVEKVTTSPEKKETDYGKPRDLKELKKEADKPAEKRKKEETPEFDNLSEEKRTEEDTVAAVPPGLGRPRSTRLPSTPFKKEDFTKVNAVPNKIKEEFLTKTNPELKETLESAVESLTARGEQITPLSVLRELITPGNDKYADISKELGLGSIGSVLENIAKRAGPKDNKVDSFKTDKDGKPVKVSQGGLSASGVKQITQEQIEKGLDSLGYEIETKLAPLSAQAPKLKNVLPPVGIHEAASQEALDILNSDPKTTEKSGEAAYQLTHSLAATKPDGSVVIDLKAVKADWDAGFPYLKGTDNSRGSAQKAEVFKNIDLAKFKRVLQKPGRYAQFIKLHEDGHKSHGHHGGQYPSDWMSHEAIIMEKEANDYALEKMGINPMSILKDEVLRLWGVKDPSKIEPDLRKLEEKQKAKALKKKPRDPKLQEKMTAEIENVINPTAKKYLPKERVKTKVATQFIGQGSPNSSTDRYMKMYEKEKVANTGEYTSSDVIYVSSNGNRRGRVSPVEGGNLQGVYKNIQKAMAAGATIIMDTREHLINTRKYNTGELALARWLNDNGYKRFEQSGYWKPGDAQAQLALGSEMGRRSFFKSMLMGVAAANIKTGATVAKTASAVDWSALGRAMLAASNDFEIAERSLQIYNLEGGVWDGEEMNGAEFEVHKFAAHKKALQIELQHHKIWASFHIQVLSDTKLSEKEKTAKIEKAEKEYLKTDEFGDMWRGADRDHPIARHFSLTPWFAEDVSNAEKIKSIKKQYAVHKEYVKEVLQEITEEAEWNLEQYAVVKNGIASEKAKEYLLKAPSIFTSQALKALFPKVPTSSFKQLQSMSLKDAEQYVEKLFLENEKTQPDEINIQKEKAKEEVEVERPDITLFSELVYHEGNRGWVIPNFLPQGLGYPKGPVERQIYKIKSAILYGNRGDLISFKGLSDDVHKNTYGFEILEVKREQQGGFSYILMPVTEAEARRDMDWLDVPAQSLNVGGFNVFDPGGHHRARVGGKVQRADYEKLESEVTGQYVSVQNALKDKNEKDLHASDNKTSAKRGRPNRELLRLANVKDKDSKYSGSLNTIKPPLADPDKLSWEDTLMVLSLVNAATRSTAYTPRDLVVKAQKEFAKTFEGIDEKDATLSYAKESIKWDEDGNPVNLLGALYKRIKDALPELKKEAKKVGYDEERGLADNLLIYLSNTHEEYGMEKADILFDIFKNFVDPDNTFAGDLDAKHDALRAADDDATATPDQRLEQEASVGQGISKEELGALPEKESVFRKSRMEADFPDQFHITPDEYNEPPPQEGTWQDSWLHGTENIADYNYVKVAAKNQGRKDYKNIETFRELILSAARDVARESDRRSARADTLTPHVTSNMVERFGLDMITALPGVNKLGRPTDGGLAYGMLRYIREIAMQGIRDYARLSGDTSVKPLKIAQEALKEFEKQKKKKGAKFLTKYGLKLDNSIDFWSDLSYTEQKKVPYSLNNKFKYNKFKREELQLKLAKINYSINYMFMWQKKKAASMGGLDEQFGDATYKGATTDEQANEVSEEVENDEPIVDQEALENRSVSLYENENVDSLEDDTVDTVKSYDMHVKAFQLPSKLANSDKLLKLANMSPSELVLDKKVGPLIATGIFTAEDVRKMVRDMATNPDLLREILSNEEINKLALGSDMALISEMPSGFSDRFAAAARAAAVGGWNKLPEELREKVKDMYYGLRVRVTNQHASLEDIGERLIDNPNLGLKYGNTGRDFFDMMGIILPTYAKTKIASRNFEARYKKPILRLLKKHGISEKQFGTYVQALAAGTANRHLKILLAESRAAYKGDMLNQEATIFDIDEDAEAIGEKIERLKEDLKKEKDTNKAYGINKEIKAESDKLPELYLKRKQAEKDLKTATEKAKFYEKKNYTRDGEYAPSGIGDKKAKRIINNYQTHKQFKSLLDSGVMNLWKKMNAETLTVQVNTGQITQDDAFNMILSRTRGSTPEIVKKEVFELLDLDKKDPSREGYSRIINKHFDGTLDPDTGLPNSGTYEAWEYQRKQDEGLPDGYAYAPMRGFQENPNHYEDSETVEDLLGTRKSGTGGTGWNASKDSRVSEYTKGRRVGVDEPDPRPTLAHAFLAHDQAVMKGAKVKPGQRVREWYELYLEMVEKQDQTNPEWSENFNRILEANNLKRLFNDKVKRDVIFKEFDSIFDVLEEHPDGRMPTVTGSKVIERIVEGRKRLVMRLGEIPLNQNDSTLFFTKNEGKLEFVKFKNNKAGARVISELDNRNFIPQNPLFNLVNTPTRFLAQMYTSFNPDFILANQVRDAMNAMLNITEDQKRVISGKLRSQIANPVKLGRIVKSIYNVEKSLDEGTQKTATEKWAAVTAEQARKIKDDDYESWFRFFEAHGMRTSFTKPERVTEVMKSINQALKGDSINTKLLENKFVKFIEHANTAVENSVRLAVAKELIKSGFSIQQAVMAGRNISVDFNRKGTLSSSIGALVLFFNAGVQGNLRFLKSMVTRSPKDAFKIAGSIMFVSFMWSMLQRMLTMRDEGEDGKDGGNKYDEVGNFSTDGNIMGFFPGTDYNFNIPIAWGWNLFWAMGQRAASVAANHMDDDMGGAGLMSNGQSFLKNLYGQVNPVGETLTPGIFAPLAQVSDNETFYGAPISRKQQDFGGAKVPEAFMNNKNTKAGFVKMAKWVNGILGGDEVTPGSLKRLFGSDIVVNPEEDITWGLSGSDLEHLFEGYGGGPAAALSRVLSGISAGIDGDFDANFKEIPVSRRFFREGYSDYRVSKSFYNLQDRANQAYEYVKKLKEGKLDKGVKDAVKNNKQLLAIRPAIEAASTSRKAILRKIKSIEADSALSANQKNAKVAELEKQRVATRRKILLKARKMGIDV